jgi:hypothetical protein
MSKKGHVELDADNNLVYVKDEGTSEIQTTEKEIPIITKEPEITQPPLPNNSPQNIPQGPISFEGILKNILDKQFLQIDTEADLTRKKIDDDVSEKKRLAQEKLLTGLSNLINAATTNSPTPIEPQLNKLQEINNQIANPDIQGKDLEKLLENKRKLQSNSNLPTETQKKTKGQKEVSLLKVGLPLFGATILIVLLIYITFFR